MMKVVLVFGAVSIVGAKFDALSGFCEPGSGDTEVSPLDGISGGSENVSKDQFYVGFSWPVPVSFGYITGWVSSPCYAALTLMRFCGSAPVCLCGFCPAAAACRWLLIYFGVLPFLWFRNLCWAVAFMAHAVVHISSFVKYVTRVARVSSSMSLQHCVSSFASSRTCEAIAATFVVAFVMLAAFAFVHSATACGLHDPAGSSCFQPGGAATLAALLAASFVFVLLLSVVQELAGVDGLDLFYVIDGLSTLDSVYWCVDGVFNIYRSCGSCILDASCSSLCASVGSLTLLEGDICFLDGVLALAVVAHCLVGDFNITCGCGSCTGLGLLSSICSAFAGVCFVFEGAFVIASSLSSKLFPGGLWFSGLAGQPQKANDNYYHGSPRSLSLQASGSITPDFDDVLIKGSGEHGIVSSLPEGLGQASGRVDVPDDAKIEAAAAFGGTLRSGPGSLDALGSARSREGKIQFFLKGHDGCTRVINCHDGDLIHDVVGYDGWDIYATLHGHILDLSGTLRGSRCL